MNRRTSGTWRAFRPADGTQIDRTLACGAHPHCPCCGLVLEARPGTRLARKLPLDATGYDLDCRGCRRFRPVVQHTLRSLRLVRMRRFVAAVRAVDGLSCPTARETAVVAAI